MSTSSTPAPAPKTPTESANPEPAKRRFGPIKVGAAAESAPRGLGATHPLLTGASGAAHEAQQQAARVRQTCRALYSSATAAQLAITAALQLLDATSAAKAALEVEGLDEATLRAAEQKIKDLAAHFGG